MHLLDVYTESSGDRYSDQDLGKGSAKLPIAIVILILDTHSYPYRQVRCTD